MKRFIALLTIIIGIIAAIAFSGTVEAAGINNNPWNYDFNATGGKVITEPNLAFCGYFHCIPNFARGSGFVVECHDGLFSKSGGHRGSCSRHGGDWRTLYAHESSTVHSTPHQPTTPNRPVSHVTGSTTTPELPNTGSDPS